MSKGVHPDSLAGLPHRWSKSGESGPTPSRARPSQTARSGLGLLECRTADTVPRCLRTPRPPRLRPRTSPVARVWPRIAAPRRGDALQALEGSAAPRRPSGRAAWVLFPGFDYPLPPFVRAPMRMSQFRLRCFEPSRERNQNAPSARRPPLPVRAARQVRTCLDPSLGGRDARGVATTSARDWSAFIHASRWIDAPKASRRGCLDFRQRGSNLPWMLNPRSPCS